MGIGNHTVTHPDLAGLNAAAARNEIDAAQTALAAILGAPPVVLAYPSGEADPTVETDAAAAGIELAVGNQPGVLDTVDDRFLVPASARLAWDHADRVARGDGCRPICTIAAAVQAAVEWPPHHPTGRWPGRVS